MPTEMQPLLNFSQISDVEDSFIFTDDWVFSSSVIKGIAPSKTVVTVQFADCQQR